MQGAANVPVDHELKNPAVEVDRNREAMGFGIFVVV